MKKLFLLCGLLFAVNAFAQGLGAGVPGVGGFPAAPTFRGNVTFAASALSTKACAANFTRVGPNFCFRTVAQSYLSLANGCTTISAPSGANAVLLAHFMTVTGIGAAGSLNLLAVNSATSGTCGISLSTLELDVREDVAELNIPTARIGGHFIVPVFGGSFFLNNTTNSVGTGTLFQYQIDGYFD